MPHVRVVDVHSAVLDAFRSLPVHSRPLYSCGALPLAFSHGQAFLLVGPRATLLPISHHYAYFSRVFPGHPINAYAIATHFSWSTLRDIPLSVISLRVATCISTSQQFVPGMYRRRHSMSLMTAIEAPTVRAAAGRGMGNLGEAEKPFLFNFLLFFSPIECCETVQPFLTRRVDVKKFL